LRRLVLRLRRPLFLLCGWTIVLLPLASLLGSLRVPRVLMAQVFMAISTVTLRHGRGLRGKRVV
jgi:hypothetical protein